MSRAGGGLSSTSLSTSFLMSLLASSVFAAGCPKAAETAASAAVSAATGVDVKVSSKGGVPQMAANYNVDGAHVAVNAGGATQVPAGFPFPVADGLTLQQATTSTEQGRPRFLVSGMTSKTPREVADFYEPLLKAKGLTVTRNEMNMGGTASIHLSASDDTRSASVSITNVGGTNMVAITSEGVR